MIMWLKLEPIGAAETVAGWARSMNPIERTHRRRAEAHPSTLRNTFNWFSTQLAQESVFSELLAGDGFDCLSEKAHSTMHRCALVSRSGFGIIKSLDTQLIDLRLHLPTLGPGTGY